jgi:hypothetical protein
MRTEIRVAEELALAALASGADADDLVAQLDDQVAAFHRRFFHLLTSRLVGRDAVTLVAHGIDHHAGLARWMLGLLDDVARRGFRLQIHLRSSAGIHGLWPETRSWGHPREPDEIRALLEAGQNPRSLLLRVDGPGAGALYAGEAGTHRFRGLASVDPCHMIVDLVGCKTVFSDGEWMATALAAAWPTTAPRGDARRDHDDDRAVWVCGRAARVDVPWPEYFTRLEEVALADLLDFLAEDEAELPERYKGTLETAVEETGT